MLGYTRFPTWVSSKAAAWRRKQQQASNCLIFFRKDNSLNSYLADIKELDTEEWKLWFRSSTQPLTAFPVYPFYF